MTTEPAKALFGSGISNAPDWRSAIAEAADRARAGLGGAKPDLALFFSTPQHALAEPGLGRRLRQRLGAKTIVGATAQAVIGGGRESEDGPGLSLFVARLPDVEPRPFSVPAQEDPEPPIEAWKSSIPARPGDPGVALLFADPFSLDVGGYVELINDTWPGLPVAGGLASGGHKPGMNRLYVDDETLEGGAAGVFLSGARARTIVSQGCRPIGKHLVITKAHGNVIEQLGGRPALVALYDTVAELDERDKGLASRALHVGRVIDERREKFGRGDFLIRNAIGADRSSGALAVGDAFRPGQTIQFHVRDGTAADEDLRLLLRSAGAGRGALLFSCNGRGKRFFGTEDHDTKVLQEILGQDLPIAGFFCGGEFGPVGGKNFVHGYTSTVVIF